MCQFTKCRFHSEKYLRLASELSWMVRRDGSVYVWRRVEQNTPANQMKYKRHEPAVTAKGAGLGGCQPKWCIMGENVSGYLKKKKALKTQLLK